MRVYYDVHMRHYVLRVCTIQQKFAQNREYQDTTDSKISEKTKYYIIIPRYSSSAMAESYNSA